MIISRVIGGLGNQMFQYAAGRAAALRQNAPFLLDISAFEKYGLHQGFELQRVFNVPAEIANEDVIHGVLGWQRSASIRRFIERKKMHIFRRKEYIVEPHFQYWSGIKHISSASYLAGYWQSERYFSEFEDCIRRDFTFGIPFQGKNVEMEKKIADGDAISLHVRRGDYVKNSKNASIYAECSPNYYQAAIEYIAEKVDKPRFFIFSDDIDWVKKNLKIEFPCNYVSHNQGAESYNDMRLMSLCDHHVIANSSFSWWGAWLNAHKNKIVVSPKNWFVNNTNEKDLIPERWVRL